MSRIAAFALAVCLTSQLNASPYTLVTEPDEFRMDHGLNPIYALISSAKKTLDMTMYELTDKTAEQLLVKAAASGVTVRVILDQNLEMQSNLPAYTFLGSNGVEVHWANKAYNVTHQKTITVDGATTAIMTLNLTSQYYMSSRDFAVIEDNPKDIAAIEATFNADFVNSEITPPNGDDLVWSPTNAQPVILGIINSASTSLLIENEEMADPNVTNALVSAAGRGVAVRVAMTNSGNDYAGAFNQLVAAGVQVSTYDAGASLYIHAKVILADFGSPAAQMFIGSENFSNGSLTRNRELGLVLSDPAIMQSIETTLSSDFNGASAWTGSTPRFSVAASPSILTATPGSVNASTVNTAVFEGFSSAVILSANNVPTGVTATFTPASIAAPGSGTVHTQPVGEHLRHPGDL